MLFYYQDYTVGQYTPVTRRHPPITLSASAPDRAQPSHHNAHRGHSFNMSSARAAFPSLTCSAVQSNVPVKSAPSSVQSPVARVIDGGSAGEVRSWTARPIRKPTLFLAALGWNLQKPERVTRVVKQRRFAVRTSESEAK